MARGAMPIARRNEVSFIFCRLWDGSVGRSLLYLQVDGNENMGREKNCLDGSMAGILNGIETKD